jgi:hypothetical protein
MASITAPTAERALRLAVIAVFAVVTGWTVILPALLVPLSAGLDARLYTHGVQVWLAGGDPYLTPFGQHYVVAPPPNLLPFLPLAWMPMDAVSVAWVLIDLVVATVALRKLELPLWWLGFPPLAAAIYVGSSEPVLLASLVFAPRFLAPIIKVYGVLPLIAERCWRALLIAAVIVAVTFPILPWDHFVADREHIAQVATAQAGDPVSAWGSPILMVVAVIALISLGIRRALWFATPALAPASQPHYSVIALPKMTMLLALFWAFPWPLMTVIGLVALAVSERLARSSKAEPTGKAAALPGT